MPTTLLATLDPVIREELSGGIIEFRKQLDPMYSRLSRSSKNVHRIGREFKIVLQGTRGLSGSYMHYGSSATDLVGGNRVGDLMSGNRLPAGQGFPGRLESTIPEFYTFNIPLKMSKGNVHIPLTWLLADLTDGALDSSTGILIRTAAQKRALLDCVAFYTTDSVKFPIVYNLSAADITNGSNADVVITLDNSGTAATGSAGTQDTYGYGRITMLAEGMYVEQFNSAGTAAKNDVTGDGIYLVVTNVNHADNAFTIRAVDASGAAIAFADDIAANDFFAPRGSFVASQSTGRQPAGLNSWIKQSGTLYPYGLSLATNPEWASISVSESGPPTERMLRKYIARAQDRFSPWGIKLDTILASPGVTNAFVENSDNLHTYERNGRKLSIEPGWAIGMYDHNGVAYDWAISTFVEPKALFVLSTKNGNLIEATLPKLAGTGTRSEFGADIQFYGNLTGSGTMLPTRGTDGELDDLMEMPYFKICEYYARDPQSLKISGLDESI